MVTLDLEAATPVERLELLLVMPPGLALSRGWQVTALRLSAGERHLLRIPVSCRHWGGYLLGNLYIRARDGLGFFVWEGHLDDRRPLRVYPRQEGLRSLPRPAETQVFAGNEVSKTKGDGIEFTDVRPFLPGDRVRRINWRLSTRRGELYVDEFHRERNTDIILFIDTFTTVEQNGESTHLLVVRGAAALAEHYLQRRDRVGMIGFGGTLRWLRPAMGMVQRYRIVESLIDTDIVLSYAWKGVDIIPRSTLPPQALVIALSPLLDERSNNALFDLRARGFDLAIVEVSPLPFVTPEAGEQGQIAFRLWKLEREALRYRFQGLGVAVVVWERGQPLERVLAEVQRFRRYARQARQTPV